MKTELTLLDEMRLIPTPVLLRMQGFGGLSDEQYSTIKSVIEEREALRKQVQAFHAMMASYEH